MEAGHHAHCDVQRVTRQVPRTRSVDDADASSGFRTSRARALAAAPMSARAEVELAPRGRGCVASSNTHRLNKAYIVLVSAEQAENGAI
jgi:hypothetical protein